MCSTNGLVKILRQYALLTNLIRKVFNPSTKKGDDKKAEEVAVSKDPVLTKLFPDISTQGVPKEKDGLITLTNENPNETKLNSLLQGLDIGGFSENNAPKSPAIDESSDPSGEDDVKVDVTLRAPLGQAPIIMLLFTVNEAHSGNSLPPWETESSNISISFEIGLNGRISVLDTAGLVEDESEGDMELRKKISRVLETSQDIGILIEWVLRWKRQHSASG